MSASPNSPNSEVELHSPGERDALQKVVVVPNPSPAAAAGTSTEEHVPDANSADRYLELLTTLKKAWRDQPNLNITWHDLSYTVEVAKTDTSVPNLASAFANLALKPFKANDSFKSLALVNTTGVVRPGTMTLILASPGHGKTTLLKALSGRLNHDSNLGGEVRYNGLNEEENKQRGVYVSRFCSFVGQQDLLFPTLTVRETMSFSSSNAIANPSLLRSAATSPEEHAFVDSLEKLEPERADRMIELLGLAECTNTIVGNDLLRGVSGGQRKRCAIGEMLLANSRTFCLDEVSVGLDAAVTLHIFNALKQVCAISNSSVVTALLQPTPETYALFDNVILLCEGRTVFHGPREDVAEWLWSVAGLEVPPGVDEAGFVVDFLTDPLNTYEQAAINAEIRLRNAEGRTVGLEEQSAKKVSAVTTVAHSSMAHSQGGAHDVVAPAPVQVPTHTSGLSIDVVGSPETAQAVTFHLQSESPSSGKQTNAVAPAPSAPAASSSGGVTIAPITGNGVNSEKLKQLRTMSSSGSFVQAYHSNPAGSPIYSAIDMEKRYKATRWYTNIQADVESSLKQYQPFDTSKWSEYTKAQFAHPFPHSFVKHTLLCCGRQSKLIARNKAFIPPRVMQAIIMGIVVGTLFYQLTPSQYTDKTALLLYVIMFGAFANLTELPVASEARNVVAKQIDAGQFPASAYTISVNLLHFPVTFFETIIFGCLVYFLAGYALDAGRFFFFLLTMTVSSHAMSTFFRSISYVAKNPDVARSMDLPFIIMFVIFGGWLITLPHVPNWLIWVFYISPFSWAFRSFCLNEFNDSKYDGLVTGTDGGIIRAGDSYIQQFGLQLTSEWKWYGILYLAGFYMFFTLTNIILLARLKPITPLGTRLHRTKHSEEAANANNETESPERSPTSVNAITVAPKASPRPASAEPGAEPGAASLHNEKKLGLNNKRSFQLTALPFTPVTLAWKNINYSVEVVNDQKQKHWRRLLNDINGFAAPGRLTALMGSSGAGKTTLMDLLAGRKTMGKIEGEILVNGYPKENTSFAKVTGYVEQNDIHMGASTVREALQFSAKLRLPTSVNEEDRERFIDEVMALVGLTDIADRMIGDVALPGLSSGQLKLVTIGVELVANPSVLFLDEPTSGIDAPSAARVMKAVRRIAATGRTVLCTIHQPSEQIFLMFDRLLLLKTGGRDVFFSDCGHKGNNLVNYFEAASGYTMLLPRGSKEVLPNGKIKHSLKINPANWMLQVVGSSAPPPPAGSKAPETEEERMAASTDYADLWRSSDLFRQAQADTEEAAQPKPNSKPIEQADLNSNQYVSNWTRYVEVQKRLFVSHWRNPPMNVTRFVLMFITGLILGVIYYKLNANDFGGVISKLSVVFMGLSFPSSVCANSALPSLFRTRAVYYRETTIGLYGYKIFSLSIFLTELPYIFAADVLFILPFYFMIGFANDAVLFFRFLLSAFLLAMTYSSLSQLWLALMPNQIASNVINGLFMSLFFMFGGLLRRPSNIAIGWKWFYALNPVPKAFLTAALGQFYCDSSNPLNNCPTVVPGPGEPPQYTYEYLTSFLETTVNGYGDLIGYLILEIAVLRILILIAMAKVSHIKR